MSNVLRLPLPSPEVPTIHVWAAEGGGFLVHSMCKHWDSGSCLRTFGADEHLEAVAYAIEQVKRCRANGSPDMTLGDIADGSY